MIKVIPASPEQEGVWFHALKSGTSYWNFVQRKYFTGPLNKDALKKAFETVLQRHDSLRTNFKLENNVLYQVVHAFVEPDNLFRYNVADNRSYNEEFSFENDILLRFTVLEKNNTCSFTLVISHIITDAASVKVFWDELAKFYNIIIAADEPPLYQQVKQYCQFVEEQQVYSATAAYQLQKGYWLNKLSAEVPPLNLNFNTVGGNVSIYSKESPIPVQLFRDIREFSLRKKVLFSAVFQLAYYILLHKITGNTNILICNIINGRGFTKNPYKDAIGLFAKRLMNRQSLNEEDTIAGLLARVNDDLMESFANSKVAYEELLRDINQRTKRGLTPLFQVLFNVIKSGDAGVAFNGLEEDSSVHFENEIVGDVLSDMGLTIIDDLASPALRLDIKCDKLFQPMAGLLIGHYLHILHQCVYTPELRVAEIEFDAWHVQGFVEEFNNTSVPYPENSTMLHLFKEQCVLTPEHIALLMGERQLTYKELDERSNQLAHYLKNKGVKAETLVPICINRSVEMVVGILGIMKSGGAYVPVDPEYPVERIAYMLEDTAASWVLSNHSSRDHIPENFSGEVILLDEEWDQIAKEPVEGLETDIQGNNLAYVIYTSGSTGKPKGVLIEHRSLTNYLLNCRDRYVRDNAVSGSYMYLPFTFDASVTALFVPLICGRSMVVSSKMATEVFDDINFNEQAPYDFIKLTPAHLYLLESVISKNKTVPLITKKLVLGGEALQPGQFRFFRERGINLNVINEYGPTEATVGCANYQFAIADHITHIPIGKPLSNVSMYILDNMQRLAPVGITGEICIGGIQVARGYLNRPGLTSEKFIKDPFSNRPGAKLYRTGDVGRWLPDGNIEFMGRMDDQVKIRGYRVEPGEIERVALQTGMMKQCVVAVDKDPAGNARLIGYVVEAAAFDRSMLIKYLEQQLPEYMVPRIWVVLESIPLTANGKIDKRSLPKADAGQVREVTYVAPRNEAEFQLAIIWQELLDVEQVGINDDFFSLGGHSLLAVRMISAVRNELHIEWQIRDVFDHPTIGKLIENVFPQTQTAGIPLLNTQVRRERVPLSFNQERLWFIDRLEGSVQYHIPWVLQIKGALNIPALESAFRQIVVRHEALRTVFQEEDGKGYQHILDAASWKMEIITGAEYANDKAALTERIGSLIDAQFDLSTDHMLRVHLVKELALQEHILIINVHHIASDGWSWGILVRELMVLYKASSSGIEPALTELPVQYADYAIWQRNYLQGALLEEKLAYWRTKLQDVPPLLLPLDQTRPLEQSTVGASMETEIDPALITGLKALSHSNGVTLFMTLLTAFKVLLYRWSGQTDLCVGTPVAGRTRQETEGLIGLFINTLALRSNLGGDPSFTSLLQQVKQTTLEAYEYQDVPFAKVVEAVVTERDPARSPVFQVLFVMQNAPEAEKLSLGEDIELAYEDVTMKRTRVDLTFNIFGLGEGMGIYAEYCTDLFKTATMKRLLQHFKELLASVVAAPNKPVSELQLLTNAEEEELLKRFNEAVVKSTDNNTLIDLFAEQCTLNPGNTALVLGNVQLTYQQLDERSKQLAHYLISKGVKSQTLVPICMERSIEMIVAIMGIMKAGGAYVPVDPEYPEERIAWMLSDTAATLLLSCEPCRHSIPISFSGEVICLDSQWEQLINIEWGERPQILVKANDLAYIVYTSGSTGKPKGVMIEHRNVITMLRGFQQVAPLGEQQEAGLMLCSYAFDVAVWEIFINLCFGGTLHLLTKEQAIDEEYIAHYIIEQQINIAYFPPTFLPGIAGYFEHATTAVPLKRLLVGVMSIRQELLQRFLDCIPGLRIINGYGPTETTICATFYPFVKAIHPKENTPIGKPVKNYQVYIVSNRKTLAPVGVPGEICIAGDGVGRGYLNNDPLTAAAFVHNPFGNDKKALMYCTGDLGKWSADGNIEYLGRQDNQAKINGYRIEPGEIEAIIQQSALVSACAVLIDAGSSGSKRLVGCVVPLNAFREDQLIAFCQKHLPDYMIPRIWLPLESIPVTLNGKIDQQVLLAKLPAVISVPEYIAPRNEREWVLAQLIEELLGVEKVGATANFFLLGGNSLLAIQFISRIKKKFGLQLPIKVIFKYPVIDQLAKYISDHATGEEGPVWPQIHQQRHAMRRIPLSFSQERVWLIDRLEGSIHYHIPWVLRVKGPLKKEALASAFSEIVNRHEVLRTVFYEEDGLGYQQVMAVDSWEMETIAGGKFTNNPDGLRKLIAAQIERPFNLAKDNMLRVCLVEGVGQQEHVLIVTLHHIAADGWSWNILLKELMSLYQSSVSGNEPVLPVLPVQYADYAIWQRNYLAGMLLEEKLAWWRSRLAGVAPLQLPLDYARPADQSTMGGSIQVDIDAGLTQKLKELSLANEVTLFMSMLSVFKILLYRWSGQDDICVGTPIAGRAQQETETLIGFFVNTLALRSDLSGDPAFSALLQAVKQTTLEAYDHQDVPFAKVVEATVIARDMSRSPLFQVMFVMQNMPKAGEPTLGNDTLLSYEESALGRTKYDLTVTVYDSGEGMGLYVEYCTDLFRASTIERMMQHYLQLLLAVTQSPDTAINKLKMITEAEEHQLLKEFNNTSAPYPINKTLVDLFFEQCAKTPDRIALVFEAQQVTYKELDDQSNQLGHYLRKKGIKEGSLVPICMYRSVEMLVGIWGIMKAGGAYVPVDPEYPAERIGYMLADTAAGLLLCNDDSRNSIPENYSGQVMLVNKEWDRIGNEPVERPQTTLMGHDLAYVIYTSGSTGKPKGVMNQHDGVVNRLLWAQDEYSLSEEDAVLQKTTFCFDVSVWELIWPLLVGSKLVLATPGAHKDPAYLKNIINEQHITIMHFVPSMLELFLTDIQKDECNGLQKVLCSGEALKTSQVALFTEKMPGVELHNLYGPTEAAIDVTAWRFRAKEGVPPVVPIGTPVANTSIYIMNSGHCLSPVGVAGEIYIGGIQVARGYLNRPELTKEKFIKDPFSDKPEAKLYRTGDIGHWLPDGNIGYLGRADDQVKIRGYRIEPGEIESIVLQSGLVQQVVVTVHTDNTGNNRLVGYVVAEEAFNRDTLITYLLQYLPDHMVPRWWMQLGSIPLTASGKVDKRSLPTPDAGVLPVTAYVPPRNETDAMLIAIWQELLGTDRIGINDNFFSLGGHSLLIIRLLHLARERNCQLQFKDVFQYQTIEQLSDHCRVAQYDNTKITGNTRDVHTNVILLNDNEGGLPLFLLPGSPGFCDPYEELAIELGKTYRVYGIQMPGLRKGEKRMYRLEDMAALAVQWIKQVQPNGPYRFVGHSFGGYMAFEITRLLEQENEKVEFICFLDTRADASQFIMTEEENILQNICDFLRQNGLIDQQYPDWAEQLKMEMAHSLAENKVLFIINFVRNKVPVNNKKNDYFLWMVLETVIVQSQMYYYPSGKVKASFLIVKAEDAGHSVDEYLGWQQYSDHIIKIKAPGDHATLIKSENASILASKINEIMV